jgi:hypothetical protein
VIEDALKELYYHPVFWAPKFGTSYIRDCSKDIIEFGNYLCV